MTIKEENRTRALSEYNLDGKHLRTQPLCDWSYTSQVQFGNLIIMLLVDIYKDISVWPVLLVEMLHLRI
jgi:hypothetical protein